MFDIPANHPFTDSLTVDGGNPDSGSDVLFITGLAGTDELGYLLSKEPELEAWEAAHPPRIDTLAGAR